MNAARSVRVLLMLSRLLREVAPVPPSGEWPQPAARATSRTARARPRQSAIGGLVVGPLRYEMLMNFLCAYFVGSAKLVGQLLEGSAAGGVFEQTDIQQVDQLMVPQSYGKADRVQKLVRPQQVDDLSRLNVLVEVCVEAL